MAFILRKLVLSGLQAGIGAGNCVGFLGHPLTDAFL